MNDYIFFKFCNDKKAKDLFEKQKIEAFMTAREARYYRLKSIKETIYILLGVFGFIVLVAWVGSL
ncbi:MAG: hypothetical protein GX896_03125 [Clostridiales bacterium]|nr:hypothetical protein [Clostridiales bacterium]